MQYFDPATLRFLLHEVHELEKVTRLPRYQDHDQESTDLFLSSIKDLGDTELYPCFREMDEQPAHYKDGKIIVHPQVGAIMKMGAELGMINGVFDYEDGGLQLPLMVNTAAYFIADAANNHLPGYAGLTQGAAELIATFANPELKDRYLEKMLSGEWAGTMCLTEPQAGSSLSDVITSASPTPEGHYLIKGQKIFISGGDHEYVDNVVHLLLARIEGAPAGTKGISLFIVPKKRMTKDGQLIPNDVTTAGDFQKMGQRGYCTTHLLFGDRDDCRAWLVGEPHQGLRYMFQMMNGARIAVGRGAAAIASAAYYASLKYAQERAQGRRVKNTGDKDINEDQTLIIQHPDVRRMLLMQKVITEGSLSLVMQAAQYHDLVHGGDEEAEKYNLLLELLTPMVKTYPSEMGKAAVDTGVQVLGGYGFCSDYILQQYYRDIRIFSIYEGTTGIQAMDLLGRKMVMQGGKAAQLLAGEMMATIQEAQGHDALQPFAKELGRQLQLVQEVFGHLSQYAAKGQYECFLADATLFLEFMGTIVVGWQWLKMAVYAQQALLKGDTTHTVDFYEGKLHCLKFYFKYEMPKTRSLALTLMDELSLTLVGEESWVD